MVPTSKWVPQNPPVYVCNVIASFALELFNFSCVDVTGTDVTGEMEVEAIIVDPSKTRIGNESNPFVADVETGDVSVCDDSENMQEFNDRWRLSFI